MKGNHFNNKLSIPSVYRPSPVAFSHEGWKCCKTAALSRIKLVLSKAYFILTAAAGRVDAIMKPRLGISFPELQIQGTSPW